MNEVTLDVSCEREDLLYKDNELIKTENDKEITRLTKEQDLLAYEKYKSDRKERERLGDFDYSEALHIQVMDILNSLRPEDEVSDYDPSLGVI